MYEYIYTITSDNIETVISVRFSRMFIDAGFQEAISRAILDFIA
jgi:hypothetical protein